MWCGTNVVSAKVSGRILGTSARNVFWIWFNNIYSFNQQGKSYIKVSGFSVLDLNAGRHILQCNRLKVVWRRLLGCRYFCIARWQWCLTRRSRQCAVVRGRADARLRGKWTFPGRNAGCAEIRCSPGREVRGRLGLRPDSVVESSVYVWSVTGSHLFGSPLRRVRVWHPQM